MEVFSYSGQGQVSFQCFAQIILDYLLYLKYLNLSVASSEVHMAVISLFHLPAKGGSVFCHQSVSRFPRGLI